MDKKEHFLKLEQMYLDAPINIFYNPTIKILEGNSEIKIGIEKKYFHAANAVHGSVYFKILDDAAFFAASSLVQDVFVLTANFEIHFLQPIFDGEITAKGVVLEVFTNKIKAKSELFNHKNELVACGQGLFVKSKINLKSIDSYKIS